MKTKIVSLFLLFTVLNLVAGHDTALSNISIDAGEQPPGKEFAGRGGSELVNSSPQGVGTYMNLTPWSGDQVWPAVAFNNHQNTSYMVVWEDHYGGGDSHIVARQLGTDGTQGLSVETSSGATGSQLAPDVAFDSWNDQYMVVWEQTVDYNNHDILARFVYPSGSNYGDWRYISYDPAYERRPVIAYNDYDNQYLVVWEKRVGNDELGQYDIVAQRFYWGGSPAGGYLYLDAGTQNQINPAVAYSRVEMFGVDQYLVIWQDYDNGNWDIKGRFVQGLTDVLSDEFCIYCGPYDQTQPDLDFMDNWLFFLATWEQHNQVDTDWDINGAYISHLMGVASLPTPLSSVGNNRRLFPAIAYNHTIQNFLVAFQFEWNAATGDEDIRYSMLYQPTLTVHPDNIVSQLTSYEGRPATDSDSYYTYLVTWEDSRFYASQGCDVYASFITTPVVFLPVALR